MCGGNCSGCCDSIEQEVIQGRDGADGADGADGQDGADGLSSYTQLTAQFTQPAAMADVTVSVVSSLWAVPGRFVDIQAGGVYVVVDAPTPTTLTVTNLGITGNAAPSTVIPTAGAVGPSGRPGSNGSNGNNGWNAFTQIVNSTVMPSVGSDVAIQGTDVSGFQVGQKLFIGPSIGYFRVMVKTPPILTLRNTGEPINVPFTTPITAGMYLTPAGERGDTGPAGAPGAAGANGSNGANGADGAPGSQILWPDGNPNSQAPSFGRIGDLAIDDSNPSQLSFYVKTQQVPVPLWQFRRTISTGGGGGGGTVTLDIAAGNGGSTYPMGGHNWTYTYNMSRASPLLYTHTAGSGSTYQLKLERVRQIIDLHSDITIGKNSYAGWMYDCEVTFVNSDTVPRTIFLASNVWALQDGVSMPSLVVDPGKSITIWFCKWLNEAAVEKLMIFRVAQNVTEL